MKTKMSLSKSGNTINEILQETSKKLGCKIKKTSNDSDNKIEELLQETSKQLHCKTKKTNTNSDDTINALLQKTSARLGCKSKKTHDKPDTNIKALLSKHFLNKQGTKSKKNIDNSEETIQALLRETSQKINHKSRKTKNRGSFEKNSHTTKKQTRVNKKSQIKTEIIQENNSNLSNDGQTQAQVIFPHITSTNWNKFEKNLKLKETDEMTKKLNCCLARMHGFEVYDTHFSGLHFVRLAVVDCLVNRKWNNLLKLVIMLSRNYIDPVFKMFIRHLCQILKYYHPAIRGTEFEEQIDLIVEKYDIKSDKRANVNNVV